MDILNNREWVTLIWGLTFLAYCISNKGIRRSLVAVVKAFFAKWIIIVFSSMVIYVLIIVYTLCEIGLWQSNQLKTTLIWVVSVAAVSLVRINSIDDDPHYWASSRADPANPAVLSGLETAAPLSATRFTTFRLAMTKIDVIAKPIGLKQSPTLS